MLSALFLLALTSNDVPTRSANPCFESAVVGRLENQIYQGSLDELGMSSVFRWDIRVRQTVIGKSVPPTLSLFAIGHAQLVPWAAARQVIFLRRGDDGELMIAYHATLPRGVAPSRWAKSVDKIAAEGDLTKCD